MLNRIKERVLNKSQKMSTSKLPHHYYRAISVRELFKILDDELDSSDYKRHIKDTSTIVNLIYLVYGVRRFNMTIKEMRELLGLTQKQFASKYNIPQRSIENWESGKRTPPQYLLQLLERVVVTDCLTMVKREL